MPIAEASASSRSTSGRNSRSRSRRVAVPVRVGFSRTNVPIPRCVASTPARSRSAYTVAKVYAELERAGVLATQRGIGTFVRENPTLTGTATRRDRERELRPLVDRLLADASAIGISLQEIVAFLKTLEAKNAKEKT